MVGEAALVGRLHVAKLKKAYQSLGARCEGGLEVSPEAATRGYGGLTDSSLAGGGWKGKS